MPFYREVMVPQGWRHAVALCFWGHRSSPFPLIVVTLNRRPRRPDFSDAELARLADVYPLIATAIDQLLDRLASKARTSGMASAFRDGSRGLLVLDARHRLLSSNPAGRRLCDRWAAPEAGRRSVARRTAVPSAIAEVCDALLRDWQADVRRRDGVHSPRSTREVSGQCGDEVVTAVVTLDSRTWITGVEPTFFVEIEGRHAVQHSLPPLPAHAMALLRGRVTAAEWETIEALGEGLSNKEIAARLGKSVDAVKFLLHTVYRKLDVSGRTRLIAMLRSGA
jgi:DNA-binding CsgD family transcriptional regulator